MITTEKVGRLPLRGTVLRSFGLSRFASHRFAPLPHIASALADLRGLAIGMAAAFAVLFLMRGTI